MRQTVKILRKALQKFKADLEQEQLRIKHKQSTINPKWLLLPLGRPDPRRRPWRRTQDKPMESKAELVEESRELQNVDDQTGKSHSIQGHSAETVDVSLKSTAAVHSEAGCQVARTQFKSTHIPH